MKCQTETTIASELDTNKQASKQKGWGLRGKTNKPIERGFEQNKNEKLVGKQKLLVPLNLAFVVCRDSGVEGDKSIRPRVDENHSSKWKCVVVVIGCL